MSRKQDADKAIDDLFGDTSVAPEQTRSDLEELRDKIDMLIETLPEGDD